MHKKFFYPEHSFRTVGSVDVGFLRENGKRFVIFDLDNTLATYDEPVPTEAVQKYLDSLHDGGITFALLSNNKPQRVETYSAGQYWFCLGDAGKPSSRGIKTCISAMNATKDSTLFVGDQLLTDCAAAHFAGIDFALVEPIKDKTTVFFRLKRSIERILLKNYRKEI